MKRRLMMLTAGAVLVGSLQVAAAPLASAACADPNCPWSPITEYVHRVADRVISEVDRICDETTEQGCPL